MSRSGSRPCRRSRARGRRRRSRPRPTGRVLGREFEVPVREGGEVVGMIKARDAATSCSGGSSRAPAPARGRSRSPWTLKASSTPSTRRTGRRSRSCRPRSPSTSTRARPAGSSATGWWRPRRTRRAALVFGIARPVPLAEVRRTAARNFGYGLGMIALALLGILPLSTAHAQPEARHRRRGADRPGRPGMTRVPVRSGNEFGKLAARLQPDGRGPEDPPAAAPGAGAAAQAAGDRADRCCGPSTTARASELEDARRFQLSLLPKAAAASTRVFEIAVSMRTATEVGGDYYDFHLAEDGALTAAVGDATGHGARAGTMVTAVKSLFSAYAGQLAPAGVPRRGGPGRQAAWSWAGWPWGSLVARLRDGARSSSPRPACPPSSSTGGRAARSRRSPSRACRSAASPSTSRSAAWSSTAGDAILMMTDGLPELANAAGDPLGYPRVRALFEELGGRNPRRSSPASTAPPKPGPPASPRRTTSRWWRSGWLEPAS